MAIPKVEGCCFCHEAGATIGVLDPRRPYLQEVDCQCCGHYAVSALAVDEIGRRKDRWLASVKLRTRTIRDQAPTLVTLKPTNASDFPVVDGWVVMSIDDLVGAAVPTVGRRMDEALVNLGLLQGNIGREIAFPLAAAWPALWGEDTHAGRYILRSLHDVGLVQLRHPGATGTDLVVQLAVTPQGWRRIEDLRSTILGASPATAFVAMAFRDDTTAAFDGAIEPALRAAGYEAHRVDRREHNNRIDDEIVAGIRAARFVLADFSHESGGVYYEAGLAHGLGKPVVFTVEQARLQHVHFDTNHFAHLLWSPAALPAFAQAITNRVLATIGRAGS